MEFIEWSGVGGEVDVRVRLVNVRVLTKQAAICVGTCSTCCTL